MRLIEALTNIKLMKGIAGAFEGVKGEIAPPGA